MKVLYDECIEALRDNKCSECNDFYQCSVCDYFQERYKKGRADYEAECQKIFEDNPPMHFNHEQIMWLKEFVKIRCNQARADVIEEIKESIIPTMYEFDVSQDTIDFCVNILEQLKEQNNG